MTPEAAVSDFIAYLDNIRQQLLDAGEDPSEHLLTVALDGENWMFMSEFQHQDNARPFMAEWYSRLATHPTIVTTTPSEFLETEPTLPEIQTIGTGSWIDGTLRTWAGEEEESLAWQRLVKHVSNLSLSKQTTQTIQVLRLPGNRCTSLKVATGSGGMASIKIAAMMRIGTFSSRSISPTFIERSTSTFLRICKTCGPILPFHHRRPPRSLNRWLTVLHCLVNGTVLLATTRRSKEHRSTLRSSMLAMTLPTCLSEWMQPPFRNSRTCHLMANLLI